MSLLGCIADDLIGAAQTGAVLAERGLRATILVGVPGDAPPDTDALIAALDSRAIPPRDARALSLAALATLQAAGCERYAFVCAPDFASTDDGNIGPVADALADALGCGFAAICPASPQTGHRVFQGHLFVGSALLQDSAARRHLAPRLRESNLVRLLSRQTDATVGLVAFETVTQGAAAIRQAMLALKEQGRRYGIIDAATEADLHAVAAAAANLALVGGSPALAGRLGNLGGDRSPSSGADPAVPGSGAVLAASCSRATLFQVGYARAGLPTLELDLLALPDAAALADLALSWAARHLGAKPVVIATAAPPDRVAALRAMLGDDAAAALTEQTNALIAAGLIALGVRRLLVAGSRIAAPVVRRLEINRLTVGPAIERDAIWAFAEGAGPAMMIACKVGSSGGRDCFNRAFDRLEPG